MRVTLLFVLLFSSLNLFAKDEQKKKVNAPLTKEQIAEQERLRKLAEERRWNQLHTLIEEEMKTIQMARRKTVRLQYRMFELMSEKVKLYKEKENKTFVAKKLKYGKKIKRRNIFKKTIKLYKKANAYGKNILKRYPNTRYKAAIYYTLALNSRDFAYDDRELGFLRKAIAHSGGQSKVNYLARTSLGEYYYNNKNWKAAIYQYEIVIKNQDDEWYTKNLLNYGWCLLKTQKFDAAINNLEKGYKLSKDEFYVDIREQAMTGLISFYVLGNQIQRGIDFIEDFSNEKHDALFKLARKASNKGFFKETEQIISDLEGRIDPNKETELYADLRLFQFDLYKQYHKPKKLLRIANLFPNIKFNEYQREDAVRKIADTVGAKQVILKKDYSKYNKEYDKEILKEIITYFDILSVIDIKEKAQYAYYKAETYYSVQLFKDALREYKISLAVYDKTPSKTDLRMKNMDAIFSCIDVIDFNKKQESKELEFAFQKYLGYWPQDKKARTIFPRLYGLYTKRKDYDKMQMTLDRYIKNFKKDLQKQKDLFKVQMDMLIKEENTELLARKIAMMQKGYLKFTKVDVKKSETILANILFNQFKKLNEEGNSKAAIAGYQKIHFTEYYPKAIKGEAAFNMGMIYTDLQDTNNAFKWYQKSFQFFTKKEIGEKRNFLEKMALRTALLHNFNEAAKLEKFILTSFCEAKKDNLKNFTNAVRNDLANDYIRKTFITLEKQSKCIKLIPLSLKKEIMIHLFENNHESDLNSFISEYKLENHFPKDITFYYERYFWKYYGNAPIKQGQYFNKLKRLKNPTTNLLISSLEDYENLKKTINKFFEKLIVVNKKKPNPNKFISNLTKRINRLKGINSQANKIFTKGHGQVSVLVYDELTKLSSRFAKEVMQYEIPIPDKNFQKQFKGEMSKISKNMRNESKQFKMKSQELIEKYELLITQRNESHLAFDILKISDIRPPASQMAITFGKER